MKTTKKTTITTTAHYPVAIVPQDNERVQKRVSEENARRLAALAILPAGTREVFNVDSIHEAPEVLGLPALAGLVAEGVRAMGAIHADPFGGYWMELRVDPAVAADEPSEFEHLPRAEYSDVRSAYFDAVEAAGGAVMHVYEITKAEAMQLAAVYACQEFADDLIIALSPGAA